jgi:TM2 domain-containing membrane protein YozV
MTTDVSVWKRLKDDFDRPVIRQTTVTVPPQIDYRQPLKNPGVAAVLSFFFVGLGQIYNGQIAKGIGMIILGVICILLMLAVIGFIAYPILWLWGIYDAYHTAESINQTTTTITSTTTTKNTDGSTTTTTVTR